MTVRVEYTYDEEAWWRGLRPYFVTLLAMGYCLVLVGGILFVGVALLAPGLVPEDAVWSEFGWIVGFCVVFWSVLSFGRYRMARAAFRAHPGRDQPLVYEFEAERIRAQFADSNSSLTWSLLKRIDKRSDGLRLMMRDGTYVWLPPDAFTPAGGQAQVEAWATQHDIPIRGR